MISDHRFLKILKPVSVPENEKKAFYAKTIEMLIECQEKEPDRKKIREIEEKYQWTILSKLDESTSNFYENVEEENKKEFINLILDEKRLRLNSKAMPKTDYEKEIDKIITKRIKYLAMILNFTDEDLKDYKKSPLKSLAIIAAVAAGATILIFGKIKKGKDQSKKEKKKGEK